MVGSKQLRKLRVFPGREPRADNRQPVMAPAALGACYRLKCVTPVTHQPGRGRMGRYAEWAHSSRRLLESTLGRVCPPAIPLQEVTWLTAEGTANPIQHPCAEHSGSVVVKSKGSRIRDLRLFCEAVDRPFTVIQKLPKPAPDHATSIVGKTRICQVYYLHKDSFTYVSFHSRLGVVVRCATQDFWLLWDAGTRDEKGGLHVRRTGLRVYRAVVGPLLAASAVPAALWRVLASSCVRVSGLTGAYRGHGGRCRAR